MTVLVFEDQASRQLYPMSLARPVYQISVGSWRLLDLLEKLESRVVRLCRDYLRPLEDQPCLWENATPAVRQQGLLAVNARLVPEVSFLGKLRQLAAGNHARCVKAGDAVVAAWLPATGTPRPHFTDISEFETWLHAQPMELLPESWPLVEYPHDLVRHHQRIFRENLEYRIREGVYQQLKDGVFTLPGARLSDYVVTDTKDGPIVLESGASIGPYCLLAGPCHVGAGARVIEHSALKDGVALGHTTKIGGEVEASVIEPFTNKQHHGFLGHSYLGSWVNLGAGTCNSDLKNTYGTVRMEYGNRRVDTDMQFVGCFIGDYAKTAINTGIFTGKTVGVCSMVYGFVTTNVPSFVNYARLFGQVTETPVDVMVATQARMFKRRNVVQRECDVRLLHAMYELTRHERQMADEPLIL